MSDFAFRIAELERQVANLLRMGTVEELDAPAARVRVRCGELLTAWLPWLTRRAGADRDWWAPEPGEQVMVLSPCGDPSQGVVLPAVYRTAHPAPASAATKRRIEFADGAVMEYDRAGHLLSATIPGSASIHATGDIDAMAGGHCTVQAGSAATVTAPAIVLDGEVSITRNLSVAQHISGDGVRMGGGSINADNHIDAGGNISCVGSNPNHHTHDD